jgi:hypothetical protein
MIRSPNRVVAAPGLARILLLAGLGLVPAACAGHPTTSAGGRLAAAAATHHAAGRHGHTRRYLVRRAPGKGGTGPDEWSVVCETVAGQESCRIETAVHQTAPSAVAATISSPDAGQSWVVAALPAAGAARLQVAQRPPVTADCGNAEAGCKISGEAAERLTQDFRAGRRFSVQIITPEGAMDREGSLNGFTRHLEQARAHVPPPSAVPPDVASPAQPEAAPPAAKP